MNYRVALALVSIALLPHLQGCIEVNFDPRGNEVSLSGSWTVVRKGANAETCAYAGIATVYLELYEDSKTTFDDPNFLRFPCEQGSFDTRNAQGKILERNVYEIRWVALDANGAEVGRSNAVNVQASFADHVDLNPANFALPASMRLDLSWDKDPGPGVQPGGCADVGNTGVQPPTGVVNMYYAIELLDPLTGEYSVPERDELQNAEVENTLCKQELSWPDLGEGDTYRVRVEGLDAQGRKLLPGYYSVCGPYTLTTAEQSFSCTVQTPP